MAKAEHASWYAGIASAVLALVALAWAVWTYFYPAPVSPPGSPPGMDGASIERAKASAERQRKFMAAWEAANYAQGNVTRVLSDQERKVYTAAYQKLRDAMHLAEVGGRDEDALRLYRESRELFEKLR